MRAREESSGRAPAWGQSSETADRRGLGYGRLTTPYWVLQLVQRPRPGVSIRHGPASGRLDPPQPAQPAAEPPIPTERVLWVRSGERRLISLDGRGFVRLQGVSEAGEGGE